MKEFTIRNFLHNEFVICSAMAICFGALAMFVGNKAYLREFCLVMSGILLALCMVILTVKVLLRKSALLDRELGAHVRFMIAIGAFTIALLCAIFMGFR